MFFMSSSVTFCIYEHIFKYIFFLNFPSIKKWSCVGCGAKYVFLLVALLALKPSAIDWKCIGFVFVAGRRGLCVSGEVVLC